MVGQMTKEVVFLHRCRAETLAAEAVIIAEMLPLAETFAVVPAVTSAETSSSAVRSIAPPALPLATNSTRPLVYSL